MANIFSDDQIDDIHQLMSIAILCGQRGADADVRPIFDVWENAYPKDAMAGIGRGLYLISHGQADEGYANIKAAAQSSETRADQAHAVLASLAESLPQLAE